MQVNKHTVKIVTVTRNQINLESEIRMLHSHEAMASLQLEFIVESLWTTTKTSLKNKFAPFQTLSRRFRPAQFVKFFAIPPGVEFLRTLPSKKKRKKNLPSFIHVLHKNVALGGLTSYSCSGRQRNVQKCVMHVQSCCFAHKTNCFLTLSLSSSSPAAFA